MISKSLYKDCEYVIDDEEIAEDAMEEISGEVSEFEDETEE